MNVTVLCRIAEKAGNNEPGHVFRGNQYRQGANPDPSQPREGEVASSVVMHDAENDSREARVETRHVEDPAHAVRVNDAVINRKGELANVESSKIGRDQTIILGLRQHRQPKGRGEAAMPNSREETYGRNEKIKRVVAMRWPGEEWQNR